jgi:hypothetical protein
MDLADLPAIDIAASESEFSEGTEVGVAGFPMGTALMRAPGWIHQFTPTLRRGVIAAVLPFPCSNPHALLLDVMSQGGASGSPVFNAQTGGLVGVLYAGAMDSAPIPDTDVSVPVSAALSLAVPAHIVVDVVGRARELPELLDDRRPVRSLPEVVATGLASGEYSGEPLTVPEDAIEFPD